MAKIVITIECETQGELIGHLNKIEQDIVSQGLEADCDAHDLAIFCLDDANCYGEHTVYITKE